MALDTLTFKAPATVNVTDTSAIIVAANNRREYLCITNLTAESIFIAIGNDAVLNSGLPILSAGASFEMLKHECLSQEAVYAIHADTGTDKACAIQEA